MMQLQQGRGGPGPSLCFELAAAEPAGALLLGSARRAAPHPQPEHKVGAQQHVAPPAAPRPPQTPQPAPSHDAARLNAQLHALQPPAAPFTSSGNSSSSSTESQAAGWGQRLRGLALRVGDMTQPSGEAPGDATWGERTSNVLTSLPFLALGWHMHRQRLTPEGRQHALSLMAVGAAATLYHATSGRARRIARKIDYWTIAISSAAMVKSVYADSPGVRRVANLSLLAVPFRPFAVSTANALLMQTEFARQAVAHKAVRADLARHYTAAALGVGAFFAEDLVMYSGWGGYVHAAWHCLACYGMATTGGLLAHKERQQLQAASGCNATMNGRKLGRDGVSGTAAGPPPPAAAARQQCSIKTLTLDGSLFDAPASGRPVGGSPKRQAGQGSAHTGSGGKPRARPAPRPAGGVLLDNGEAEAAFIDTLRTHYTRNGTAECFAPKFSKSPTKTYSRNGRPAGAGAGGSGGEAGGAAASTPPGGLVQQEQALWEEREEELVDAQERRFAQLEDALAARESKREAYLVHRLEATAAKKIEEHRRVQEAAARARELAVQRVQQLPSLQKARAAAQPASPTAAALQKLGRRPPCPASPGLAAVQQAAAKATGVSVLSPLDAAKDAVRTSLTGGRSGSCTSACPAAASPADAPASASEDGSERLDGAEGLPRSRRASSLGSGASMSDGEPGEEEAAGGPAEASLDTASHRSQPLAAAGPLTADEPAGQLPAQPAETGSEEGGEDEEEAQPLPMAGGSGRGSSEALEDQLHVGTAAKDAPSAGQPNGIGGQPSASEAEEGSSGSVEQSAPAGEAIEDGCSTSAALAPPDEEPVTAVMLAAEVITADAPVADAEAGAGAMPAAEVPAVAAVAEMSGAEAALPPLEADAGATPAVEPGPEPALQPAGAAMSIVAAATGAEGGIDGAAPLDVTADAAEAAPLDAPAGIEAVTEPEADNAQLAAYDAAVEEPVHALEAAAPEAASPEAAAPACRQEMEGPVVEQAAVADLGGIAQLEVAEPGKQAASPAAAQDALPSSAAGAAGGPAEVPAAEAGQAQEAASVTVDEGSAAAQQQLLCVLTEGPAAATEGSASASEVAPPHVEAAAPAAGGAGAAVPELPQLAERAPVAATAELEGEQPAARCSADEATVSSRLHNPAAACVRKRAARRRRTGRSFDQLLQSGDAAAAACAEYLACGPLQAGAGNQKGDQEAGQEPAGLLPDTPPKPAGQPRLLLSCQSTRVLLSPRSRGTLSSDAAAAQAGGNGLGDSKDMEAVAAPTGVVAAPPAAAAPLAAAPPAAALQEQQLAREIELQLAQQARQAQQAQQLLQEVELQLALQAQQTQQAQQASLEMQLAREAQVAWLVQQAQQAQQAQQVQHALQAQQQQAVQAQQALLMQQAQQATWLPPASPLAGTGLQPPGDMNARWQDAASLVAALPASQAQPLLQPVEPLPPPPPLPNARMLQLNSPGQLPCAVPGGCGGPLDAASLDAAALEAVLELPSGLDAQIPDQMLLPFLDDSLLDLIDW
ncbi:hypothetical protein C2E21_5382 [Chlorella sorokiniana]|uniref:Uncharacterized protein n=1 Tax=Chlorella sorokiniana TaxID=3076 RepID=A0A2P6TNJ3_CHLSO|nr:hypothetical protein C2E21_5382 [Chlorella sorokiniana]|eukprot:PRW50907.1 hypothetical protein C2E21_5382 [Chlorella sorokiniana]